MADKLYIDTLTEAEIAKIEARLRPDQSSRVGFLGLGESLKDVIHHDAETLRKLDLTHEQVADELEYLVTHPGDVHSFRVEERTYRGWQEDPFQEKWNVPPHSSVDFTVTNSAGESVRFPGLIITLIRQYQFFEGNGTHYRLDPEEAVRVLQIKPDERYKTQQPRPVTQPDKPKVVYRGG